MGENKANRIFLFCLPQLLHWRLCCYKLFLAYSTATFPVFFLSKCSHKPDPVEKVRWKWWEAWGKIIIWPFRFSRIFSDFLGWDLFFPTWKNLYFSNLLITNSLINLRPLLGTFEEVEGLPGPHETSDETYTQSKFDISGSNETMQNALASIV